MTLATRIEAPSGVIPQKWIDFISTYDRVVYLEPDGRDAYLLTLEKMILPEEREAFRERWS
jgi:hypothetical protein